MKLLMVFLGVCVAVRMTEMCRDDCECDHETRVGDGWSVNCHFAVSMAEMCRDDGDCDHETCVGDGWSVNCHFGTCTCDHTDSTGGRCVAQDDCTGHCPANHRQHCVDGHCRCLRN